MYNDNWGQGNNMGDNKKSFHEVMNGDEKELLKWLTDMFDALIEDGKDRTRQQRENLQYYRGIASRKMFPDRNREDPARRLNKLERFIVNHLFDLTETRVSQMTRLKPAIEVLPTNDEWADRASAKITKMIVDHLWYINNIDYIFQSHHRYARIFGESYIFVDWDPNAGDLDPSYVKAKETQRNSDDKDPIVPLPDGGTYNLDKDAPIKTGDVAYALEVPWRVLVQKKPSYDEAEYMFRVRIKPAKNLQEKYPDKKLTVQDQLPFYDLEECKTKFIEDHILSVEFTHKKTEKVPDGRYILFTKQAVLENESHQFSHGGFNCTRLTDMDIPETQHGVSRFEHILPMQRMYNNLSTLIAKNIYLGAHAKWMMPRGACKIEQLGSDNTVVQYQGPQAPTLVTYAPVSPDAYKFRDMVKLEMQTIYGSHGISRGEIPKGITATSALQFLNELETERATTDISKHGFQIRDLAKLTISTAGDKYKPDDGRMMRIAGKNNKYLIRHFDTAHLHKSYDIRFDLSTGLPEHKSAKYQRILDAMQRNPQMLSPERWQELLDLANIEKMNSLITEAIRSADSENEDMLEGIQVAPPEDHEDHIQHWQTHAQHMQSRSYKEEAPEEVRAMFKDHLYMTEELMLEKARTSPLYQSQLAQLTNFPIYFHRSFTPPASAEHQQAMVQGQANAGNPVTGMIPSKPMEQIQADLQNKQK